MELFQGLADIGLRGLLGIAVDFAVIAGLAYFVLRTLRDNAVGTALVVSTLFLGLVYLFARLIDLEATSWLFESGTQWIAFTLVVLFQDDIRRLILKANPSGFTGVLGRIFGGATVSKEANEKMIRDIIDAAKLLMEQKLGALIVVDRGNDLKQYTESAVKVDAHLTKELLFAIFVPTHENPLHDGAAIITPERIVAAGVFLPLTTNSDIDLLMGTRHRAGIGLSDVSDALVVVVSEERQTLTICEHGRYHRFEGRDIDKFRGALQKHLNSESGAAADKKHVAAGAGGGR